MKLTLLAKDGKSQLKDCPSVYLADTGELVVQGPELDAGDMQELQNPLSGETAVRIDPEIILRAVEFYKQGSNP
ncbi:MAG: hypothetical protein M0026_22170 [Nocardiopsaceae bacterium]|nr:hypothetical protein [Nocardiopsaceae bacterium]